jgi:hypothetical protein
MGYSVRAEVEQALANALTSGNPTGGGVVSITTIGNTLSDTVSDDQIAQYIRWADEQIDAVISSIYRTPLRRVNKGTFRLAADAVAGDDFLLLEDAGALNEDNLVIPQGNCVTPTSPAPPPNFKEPPDSRRLCLWLPIANSYDLNLARVERIRFPDPIPKTSARIIRLELPDANEYVGRRYYNQALDDVPSTRAEPGQNFLSET